jgi:opacity protein-like surface antigen
LAATPRLSLRAELSGNTQELSTRSGGPISGDVQQGRASLAARFTPVTLGRFAPYVLAGAGWFWQSDRIVLTDISNPVPDANYRQTSSQNSAGAILGAGATAPLARLRVFAEGRWTRVGADAGSTTDLTFLAGVAVPLGR